MNGPVFPTFNSCTDSIGFALIKREPYPDVRRLMFSGPCSSRFFSSTVDPFHWRSAHANLMFPYGLAPLHQDNLLKWRYTVVNEERGKKKKLD